MKAPPYRRLAMDGSLVTAEDEEQWNRHREKIRKLVARGNDSSSSKFSEKAETLMQYPTVQAVNRVRAYLRWLNASNVELLEVLEFESIVSTEFHYNPVDAARVAELVWLMVRQEVPKLSPVEIEEIRAIAQRNQVTLAKMATLANITAVQTERLSLNLWRWNESLKTKSAKPAKTWKKTKKKKKTAK